MKRIKRQSINLKAKAIDLQKIKANNAPNTDEHNPADRGRHMQLGAAAAEPIPMHVQDVTFLLTAQKQRRQRRSSSSSVLTEVDVLTAPSMGQEWSQRKKGKKKKQLEELAMASDWLLNSLTTLDATRLLDSGTDQATQADADADTNVDRHPFRRGRHPFVCESGRAKLPGKLGRLHAAKV